MQYSITNPTFYHFACHSFHKVNTTDSSSHLPDANESLGLHALPSSSSNLRPRPLRSLSVHSSPQYTHFLLFHSSPSPQPFPQFLFIPTNPHTIPSFFFHFRVSPTNFNSHYSFARFCCIPSPLPSHFLVLSITPVFISYSYILMATSSPSSRFSELLDLLKAEYDRVSSENQGQNSIRSECSRKFEEQVRSFVPLLSFSFCFILYSFIL